jgi:hypothetical protein
METLKERREAYHRLIAALNAAGMGAPSGAAVPRLSPTLASLRIAPNRRDLNPG